MKRLDKCELILVQALNWISSATRSSTRHKSQRTFPTAWCSCVSRKSIVRSSNTFHFPNNTFVSIYARLCNLSRFHIAGTVSQVHVPDPRANFIPFYFPDKEHRRTSRHASMPGWDAVSGTTEKIAPLKPSRTTLPPRALVNHDDRDINYFAD